MSRQFSWLVRAALAMSCLAVLATPAAARSLRHRHVAHHHSMAVAHHAKAHTPAS